ncbi:MAG: penicillin acylase family protein [Gammaproteobacteria bacterium]|nr:penicillin acylase family protein [Gammaproteobacteria bacterium]
MLRGLKRLLYAAGVLVLLGAGALWLVLRASLALLDGAHGVTDLAQPVSVERDALGVVTIRAADRIDLARATGFVHAQERFFQMDLLRRTAAGELAALVGAGGLALDLERRVHRLRGVARTALAAASPRERALLEAYAAGVNSGLDALRARPPEYLVLRARPQPWRAEDTFLVVHAMYFELHDEDASREAHIGRLHDALPGAMFAFLTQPGTALDAPMLGRPVAELSPPGPEVCDLGRTERPSLAARGARGAEIEPETPAAGSNAWALGARRVRGGGAALLANDMHLSLRLPNVWFRMRLIVAGSGDDALDVTGVTLPGTPTVAAGSNGDVAWGLTNTYGDWVDRVVLELDADSPARYRTAAGYRELDTHLERIRVKDGGERVLEIRSTIWGPVIDGADPPQALKWLAHEAEATNAGLLALERVRNVDEALAAAPGIGIPPQNLVVADSQGNVAWTIAGRMPRRQGYDPRMPASWAGPERGWLGWVAAERYPAIVNPPSASVWSANNRVVDGDPLAMIGDGGYVLGARAAQIRDALALLEDAGARDMLDIALDDRALWLERWRALLLERLDARAPELAALAAVVRSWDGRAGVDAAGFRLVRAFRSAVHDQVFSAIVSGCADAPGEVRYAATRQSEGALWRLVREQPRHLLDPRYASWDALLDASADAALASCGGGDPADCTWGELNRVHLRHPLTLALPVLSHWLDIGPQSLPGGVHVPRVQLGNQGASERFAVAPGDEEAGYFHMPGGQSGHPLSPFYDEGHAAWVAGEPTPFLPGPARYRLTLLPAAPAR